jgi:imidazolonepropionase-like amidohydrolase
MLAPKRSSCCIFAAVALLWFSGSQAHAESTVTVLKGFTLIDGTGHAPAPNSAMIISNGRIDWVGRMSSLTPVAGAHVVDYVGKYVMPGIIDLHVHLGNTIDMVQDKKNFTPENVENDLRIYASYGVTTVMSLGTDSDLIFKLRREPQDSMPPMSRVYTAGQGFVFKGGYGGLAGVNQPVSSAAEVDAAVAAQAAKGVDIIKLWLDDEFGSMPKMPADISKAIIDAAHRRHLRAVAHVFYLEDAKRLIAQGIDGLAHSIRDVPIDQATIDAMKQHNTWQLAETLSREASMSVYAQRAPFLDDPFFTRAVSAKSIQILADPEHQKRIRNGAHFADYPKVLTMAEINTKRLLDAGVHLGFGTDSGPPGRFPGYFEHWELALLVDAGLTPMQALQVATRDSAKFLRADDLGTLQASKRADLVVLDADPTIDIKNTRLIHMVYVAGRPVETKQP